MTDPGSASEDLVTAICDRMFFRDFVVRNPKFRTASGHLREASDVLVLDDRTLLALQVKSKELAEPGSAVHAARLEAAIEEGVKQLKTLDRALSAKQLTSVTNLRGVEIPLDKLNRPTLIGVVILDVRNEDAIPEDERPSIEYGLSRIRDIPAHIFLRSTFSELATELDTLPDFLDYLSCRQSLMERRVLGPLVHELDLLAIYKTQRDVIEEALAGKCDMLFITPGSWDDYKASGADMRASRTAKNEPSYLIDGVIDFLHTGIGAPSPDPTVPAATAERYLTVISELGRLTRLERRVFGEKMMEKLESATKKETAFAVMTDASKSKAVFFMATSRSRTQRQNGLQNLCHAAAHKIGVRRILGIATEPADVDARTFDVYFANDIDLDQPSPTISDLADSSFGPQKAFHRKEWE